MRILAFTDVHGDLAAIKKLIAKAKKAKVDALVCAGDISFFGFGLKTILRRFDIGIPLIIIPGNHETTSELRKIKLKLKFIHNIHRSSYSIDLVLFLGCGGSTFAPVNITFEASEKKFISAMKKFKSKQKNHHKIVLLVHEPPYGTSLDLIHKEHLGSSTIRAFIERHKPQYCICGHFEENSGKRGRIGRTVIINPGPDGKIIRL